MARKIFKRIGIRRDRNLGDLSNTTEALNNLLDTLVDGKSTFVSEDLDAIRGSFSIGFSNAQYRQIIGSAEFTTNQSGLNSPFLPRITYQNKLDNFKIFAGEPRLFGGNGLTAKYYESSDINVNSVGIFSGTPFKIDNFWEAGNFTYSGKITPESLNLNGGVEWEGFFIPTVTGTHSFTINSSACFTFDFETQGYVGDPTGTIVPFQRYYNATSAFNFYTTDPSSENLIGYSLQNREAFWAYTTQVSNTLPIYRAANSTGSHLYTISLIEYNGLPVSWTREGIVGYAYGAAPANITNQPIYRANNPTTGDFLYTTSLTEVTTTPGYTNEGVAFYSSYPSYTEINRIGLTSSLSASGTINTDAITLTNISDTKYVGVGQSVSGVGINPGTVVASVNRTNGVVGLTPQSGNAVTASFTNQNKIFSKSIGNNTAISYTPYTLIQYRPYRVKFRYFIPQGIDAESVSRYINFDLFQPGGNTNGDIRYNYLYSSDYDFSDQALGSFNSFLNNSILSGGGTLGGTTNSDDYVTVSTDKKIDIKYQPKTTYAECIKSLVNGSTTSGTPVVSLTNPDTTNIEVGNYVFGTGIPNGSYGIPTTRVSEIIVNSSVILNANTTVTTTNQAVSFVEHRGLVKVLAGSIFNGVVSLINPGAGTDNTTTGLTKDMIVIGTGLQPYTKITTIQTASSFIVSPSQTTGAVIVLLVYQSKGLINNGLVSYCVPAETRCAIVTNNTPSGSLSLTVNSSDGIGIGWIVQGPQFTVGTAVTSIPNATTIGISTGTILGFNAGSNFTATSASGDRTICCPPTDTSPPFNPTLDGLDTVPAAPSLRIESGNLRFDSLVGIVSESNITEYSSNDVSGSRISIQTSGGVFGILCV